MFLNDFLHVYCKSVDLWVYKEAARMQNVDTVQSETDIGLIF